MLDSRLKLKGVVFELNDTYMKYLRSNPWLEPMGDEGTYRVKLQFASAPKYPSVSKVKGLIPSAVSWNGLDRLF
jgi:hypothetical protein